MFWQLKSIYVYKKNDSKYLQVKSRVKTVNDIILSLWQINNIGPLIKR